MSKINYYLSGDKLRNVTSRYLKQSLALALKGGAKHLLFISPTPNEEGWETMGSVSFLLRKRFIEEDEK